MDGPAWFEPKVYGYGAGQPATWQGWLLTIVYIAIMAASAILVETQTAAMISVMVLATGLFVLIAARTTRGGWRWRWGKRH